MADSSVALGPNEQSGLHLLKPSETTVNLSPFVTIPHYDFKYAEVDETLALKIRSTAFEKFSNAALILLM